MGPKGQRSRSQGSVGDSLVALTTDGTSYFSFISNEHGSKRSMYLALCFESISRQLQAKMTLRLRSLNVFQSAARFKCKPPVFFDVVKYAAQCWANLNLKLKCALFRTLKINF